MRNDLANVIQRFPGEINTVYDIGANKGQWTRKWLQVLPKARFYLFEANPKQRAKWLRSQDRWFNCVLSSPEIKEVDFYSVMGTGDSYYRENTGVYDSSQPIKLQTSTLDQIVTEEKIPSAQLIKMDTQGSELDIIAGGLRCFSQAEIVLTEIPVVKYNEGAPVFNDYIEALGEVGFVPVGVEGSHGSERLIQFDLVFLKEGIQLTKP